jgi:hypothetical protein
MERRQKLEEGVLYEEKSPQYGCIAYKKAAEGLFLGKTMNRHSSLADIQFCVKPQFSPSMIAAIWRRAPPTVMHR